MDTLGGGLWENGYAPTITTSAWEFNNYVLEIRHNCDIDTGTERRGEGEAKDIRGQRSEVQEGQDTEDRQGGGVIGTVTTLVTKDLRIIEIYEEDIRVVEEPGCEREGGQAESQ